VESATGFRTTYRLVVEWASTNREVANET